MVMYTLETQLNMSQTFCVHFSPLHNMYNIISQIAHELVYLPNAHNIFIYSISIENIILWKRSCQVQFNLNNSCAHNVCGVFSWFKIEYKIISRCISLHDSQQPIQHTHTATNQYRKKLSSGMEIIQFNRMQKYPYSDLFRTYDEYGLYLTNTSSLKMIY